MASVSVTRDGTFCVRWRDSLKKAHQKNFKTRSEAKRYAAMLELSPTTAAAKISLADFMSDYRDNVSLKKRGVKSETVRINRLMQRPFAQQPIGKITPAILRKYFEQRAEEPGTHEGSKLSEATIIKEMGLLSAIFTKAVRDGLIEKSPMSEVKRPKEPAHRERVVTDEEIELLKISAGWDGESEPVSCQHMVLAAFLFCCKTGMRGGEVLQLEESWIEDRVIHIPAGATKTQSRRDVAMCAEALRILNIVRQSEAFGSTLWRTITPENKDAIWRKVRTRAGLGPVVDSRGNVIREGLNFHDSRATFCTWVGLNNLLPVQSLARQTGHHDLKMLMRYYRPTAAQIADQLDKNS